jgi:phosphatidylinositol alpha-1,6-mannosyltransferase
MVGRIDKEQDYKGHRQVIGSWAGIVAAVPEARLVVAGAGTGLDAMKELARQSAAAASLEFLGFVSERDMPALWRRTHVFAMPSRNEGFGIVYIEAMRHRVPVIASVYDAGREVNVDGVTGFNVELDRPAQLADAVVQLLREPDRARAMGEAGHARWRDDFRYGAFAVRLNHALSGFLDLGGTAGRSV